MASVGTDKTERASSRLPVHNAARAWRFVGRYGTLVVLGIMAVGFSLASPNAFPTMSNFTNVVSQMSLTAIVAGGLTMPLVAGEFDLSIGYMASLSGVLVVGLIDHHVPVAVAFAIVLALGLFVGFINGMIVTKLGVNALIATLGTGTILVGCNYWYAGGIPIALSQSMQGFTELSLGRAILGVPNPIVIMAAVLIALWVLLNQTPLGQHIQAVGANPEAAMLAGVRVDATKTAAFMISGVCAALAGALLASRIGSGQITAGDGYMLDAFAAVFLGSAALRDGVFHIVGTFIGVLTVGLGFNGLAILGVPSAVQFFFRGGLLVVAVALSSAARKFVHR